MIFTDRINAGRSLIKSAYDDEYEIGIDDVIEYIDEYASADDLKEIVISLGVLDTKENNKLEGSYVQEEKRILFELAAKKYTLEELEQRLGGNKFDLI